jgi:hypothetical protein
MADSGELRRFQHPRENEVERSCLQVCDQHWKDALVEERSHEFAVRCEAAFRELTWNIGSAPSFARWSAIEAQARTSHHVHGTVNNGPASCKPLKY